MKRITIVGVGALGSHVTMLLRNVDATVRVVDFDRVEQKNTQSQFFGRPSVGKSKVEGLKQSMQFLFGSKLEGVPHKLTLQNESQLLGGSDLIIDALDNGEARRIVQGFAKKNNIPCLHGALDANGSFGRIIWTENFKIDDEGQVGAATCENGEHLPFISVAASFMAYSAQEFLTKGKKIGFQVHPSGAIRV